MIDLTLIAGILAMWVFMAAVTAGAWWACSVFGPPAERAVDEWERREWGERR